MKVRYLLVGLAGTTAITASALGAASAAGTSHNGNVGKSNIPRSVFDQDRLNAAAEVLKTTTDNIKNARQNHTLNQLVKNAGLTRQTFGQKVQAQLTSELEAQGYSQDQITIAEQHRSIMHLRHQMKRDHDKDQDQRSNGKLN